MYDHLHYLLIDLELDFDLHEPRLTEGRDRLHLGLR
jgi:hypothetical protein